MVSGNVATAERSVGQGGARREERVPLAIRLRRHGWSKWQLIAAPALVCLGILATLDAWMDMFHLALRDEESSHIFLVPVVAAWLFWVRRGRLRYCRPRGQWIGTLIVAAGWFFHSFGDFYLIEAFWHGGAVLVAIGCLLSVLGKDILFKFLPVFAVCAFLVPVPGLIRHQIAMPLQTATAVVTHEVLDFIGITAERSVNVITINGVEVAIAEACNGLRMVFALVLVSFAFSFGLPLRNYLRVLILAASPLSAILCNVIRLVPTVWVYGRYSEEVAGTIHDVTGWVMLPIAFLMLLGIIRLLKWAMIPVTKYTLAYEA